MRDTLNRDSEAELCGNKKASMVNAAGISDFISNEASSLCRIRSPKSFED